MKATPSHTHSPASQYDKQMQRSFHLRILVIFCLVGSIIIAGYFPYRFFRYLEYSRAIQEYRAVVNHAETSFQIGIANKIESQRAVDTFMTSTCPLASNWPNCSVTPKVFDTLSVSMKGMGGMTSIGMAPLISSSTPEVLHQFEHYVSEVYLNANITEFGAWKYPNSTVRGITAVDETKGLFHDLKGRVNNTNDYLAPIMHFTGTTYSPGAAGSVLFNINYEPLRLDTIGAAVSCFEEAMSSGSSLSDINCERITAFVVPQLNFVIAPAAMIVHPVAVEGELKALVFTTHYWGTVIDFSIPSYVNGVVVVVSCNGTSFTYKFNDGEVGVPTEGDSHSKHDDDTAHCFVANIYGKEGIEYNICMYASDSYFADFADNRAIYACITGVMISVITGVLFFLYDFFLSRSAREHQVILATKRAFVRYISHEIRTPLNTVNIGLKVLMQELMALTFGGSAVSEPASPSVNGTSNSKFNAKQKELMDLVLEIEDSSDTAVGILNDLINYDKISMNNMQLELQVVNIFDLLKNSFAPFLIQARQKQINMTLDMDVDNSQFQDSTPAVNELRVVGDSVKLMQVMRNLLSNALKFTPHDGRIEMTARWEPKNTHLSVPKSNLPIIDDSVGALTISVKDSGAGISVADQEDLFKEGRQFNANRLQGGAGSGLGLFITMGVVKLHGGVLSSHSDGEGCGSTFSLTLPVAVASEVEGDGVDLDEETGSIKHNVTENTYEVLQSQGGSMDSAAPLEVANYPVKSHLKNLSVDVTELNICNVMVVDDSLPSRKMLCRLLKNGGYNCSQAENGQDCVELMVNNRDKSRLGKDIEVQMVFMDYEMPLMNGPEAAKTLRDLGFTCPIIGVTGNVLPVDKAYFISMGANDVLSKPLYLDDLNACVRKYSREHTPRGSVTWQPALTSPRAEDVTHALTLHVDDVACDL